MKPVLQWKKSVAQFVTVNVDKLEPLNLHNRFTKVELKFFVHSDGNNRKSSRSDLRAPIPSLLANAITHFVDLESSSLNFSISKIGYSPRRQGWGPL